MENYLKILKKRNVFVKTVESNGIAYHSRLVSRQANFVQKFIEKVYYILYLKLRCVYLVKINNITHV